MRGVILAAVCCLVGTVASAATVVVRAGEHDGFTRIVLQLPAEVTWSLGHKADGYLLVTEGGDVGFDLAKTFEHIGRNRIAAIEATGTPGALMLKLACDCQAVASRTSAGLLVIDVADGSIGDAAKVQAPLDPVGAGKLSDLERFWLRRFSTEEMTPSDGSGTSEGPSPAETDQSRLETAARLLEWQVSRAMGQGLVEPSEVTPDAQLHPSAPGRADGPDMPATISLGVSAGTAQGQASGTAVRETTAPACPDPADFAAGDWADGRDFRLQISEAKDRLVGEFDAVDAERVIQAGRLYLYYGMGSESRSLVRAFGIGPEEDRHVAALAEIVEGKVRAGNPILALDCDADIALWRILADPARISKDNTAAVLSSFSKLPVHLRNELGPRLGSSFLEHNDLQAARAVRDAMARTSVSEEDVTLMDFEIALSDPDGRPDPTALVARLSQQGENTARSVVLAVDAFRRRDLPVPVEVSDLAETLSYENRNLPLWRDLRIARARALASQGQFVKAFASLDEAPRQPIPFPADLFQMLADKADDDQFVEVIFDHMALAMAPEHVAQWNAIGTRLVTLGFAKEAAGFLRRPAQSDEDRLLAARVEAAEGRKDAALNEIRGLTSDAVVAFRNELLVQAGGSDAGGSESVKPLPPAEDAVQSDGTAATGILGATRALIERSSADRLELEKVIKDLSEP